VFYETSFYSKQPKLEPILVSILSETRRLFRLFRFNIETACFGVYRNRKKPNRNKQKIRNPVNVFKYLFKIVQYFVKKFILPKLRRNCIRILRYDKIRVLTVKRLFRYRFETLKRTEPKLFFGFAFRETN
jgi:hypothetical protein